MQDFLRDIDYGNADAGGEADAFWLTGDLRISAMEQVKFLTRLATGRLEVSGESVAAIRDALGREVAPGVALYTKTGSGRVEGDGDSGYLGWQSGWAERHRGIIIFAFWTEAETYQAMRERRGEFMRVMSRHLRDGIP